MNIEYIASQLEKMLKKASKEDESPVAAIITCNNKIIAKAYNKRNKKQKTTNHAEIIAIEKANKKLSSWRLNKCTLYVTLEPCEMCKNVIKESRIETVYFFIKREKYKKQYNKTNFIQIDENNTINKYKNNYEKIIKKFWENKR